MSTGFSRIDRVAEMIQRKLAEFIQKDLRDPALSGLVTLSNVKLSKDLGYAKVYFTVLNQDPEKTAIFLNSKAALLRTLLAKSLTTHTVPELHFYYDESIEYSSKLSRLIDQVNPTSPDEAED